MGTRFAVTAKHTADVYADEIVVGDSVSYSFDATPWQEDNSTITSAAWVLESGNVTVTDKTLVSGVASALISSSEPGRSIVSVLLQTATAKKKIYLVVHATDNTAIYTHSDYGS